VNTEKNIFRRGSTTYYFSSVFFPKAIKQDVFKLYSFVRVADDYVDAIPSQDKKFHDLRRAWNSAKESPAFDTVVLPTDSTDKRVVKNMIFVARKYDFDMQWVESFLDSMQADLDNKEYKTMNDTLWYMFGSAEVIGLMMAKIMGLPSSVSNYAKLQGRAMQYINFVRDIAEDNKLGRSYFPLSELKKYSLRDVSYDSAKNNPEGFSNFLRAQIDTYNKWQTEADKGMSSISKRLQVPLQTSVDMYSWTAQQIYNDPLIVFEYKVKPSRTRVLKKALQNIVT
jgi:15-cis-phytoene synthase